MEATIVPLRFSLATRPVQPISATRVVHSQVRVTLVADSSPGEDFPADVSDHAPFIGSPIARLESEVTDCVGIGDRR